MFLVIALLTCAPLLAGLEMHARPLRLDLQYVGGNYHACVAACIMNGTAASLAVLTRQSMGIASLVDGTLELMLHRRVNTSDSQGCVCVRVRARARVCVHEIHIVCLCARARVFVVCVCAALGQ
jgi:hypothetical protein